MSRKQIFAAGLLALLFVWQVLAAIVPEEPYDYDGSDPGVGGFEDPVAGRGW